MDCAGIKKLLEKYKIDDIDSLEYILGTYNDYTNCIERHENDIKNLCLDKNCFDNGVPACRRVIEIYNKFYKSIYDKKYKFISYLEENTESSKSSIENWLSCKQCTNSFDEIVGKVNDDFIDDLCKNLKFKFDKDTIFEKEYKSVRVFIENLSELTKDNFTTELDKREKRNKLKMEKHERDKLFDIIHSSKNELKETLKDPSNIHGTDEYKLNLALEAFNRKLDDEALVIVNKLKDSKENHTYLQLKAKLLSNKEQDKEAIEVLNKLIKIQNPEIDVETNNLLGASIKREAYKEFCLYSREDILITKFEKSKSIYKNIFNLNSNYYPAINIVYLEMMLSIIRNDDIEKTISNLKVFWNNVKFEEKDYWSYLSNIEFLIITREYNKAREKIGIFLEKLNEVDINEFKSFAANRQLKMYMSFCKDKELKDIQKYLIESFT